jgi:hypothetical protein
MQALILNMSKLSEKALNRDWSRDLFIIGHCEAFKHEAHFLIINILIVR